MTGAIGRAKARSLELSNSLGFVPGLIVAVFTALGIVIVEIDEHVDLDGVAWVFAGDGSAARTVLSVIAGSLITVAGLTFSITMVVLQLASGQFSPRILRAFFGDRRSPSARGPELKRRGEAGRASDAYTAPDFARLVEVKRAYDPDNLFRVNANIAP